MLVGDVTSCWWAMPTLQDYKTLPTPDSPAKHYKENMRLPLPQFTDENRHPDHIAEVIETATTTFLAQCLEPDSLSFPTMPTFGSWVKSMDEKSYQIYGIINYVSSYPIDSVHRARALGLSLGDLREQQPQIFAMLATEFRATIVGFEKPYNNSCNVYQYLPPRPPQIHQGVYRCEPSEVIHFSERLDFLTILLQTNETPPEALIAATMREIYHLRNADRNWLIQAGKKLSILLKDDYDRLRDILRQIHY